MKNDQAGVIKSLIAIDKNQAKQAKYIVTGNRMQYQGRYGVSWLLYQTLLDNALQKFITDESYQAQILAFLAKQTGRGKGCSGE